MKVERERDVSVLAFCYTLNGQVFVSNLWNRSSKISHEYINTRLYLILIYISCVTNLLHTHARIFALETFLHIYLMYMTG